MTLSAASVCSKVNEQITNFFISAALEIAYFPQFFLARDRLMYALKKLV